MRVVPLQATPNQQLTVNIDGNRWTLRIKQAVSSMIVDVSLNDVPILMGQRIVVGTPVIPYEYLAGFGNFIMLTDDDMLVDWRQFGTTQTLLYVPAGMVAI